MKKFLPLFLLPLIFGSNCKKSSLSELEKLPPATQTGANTFGCLVNGTAFMPSGYDGSKPNFSLIIDASFQNGNFDLRAYRLEGQIKERISIFSNNIKQTGVYHFNSSGLVYCDYKNETNNCYLLFSPTNYAEGFIKITRYDLVNGIFAGEFECKMYDQTTSCDTIRITNGRFDKKL